MFLFSRAKRICTVALGLVLLSPVSTAFAEVGKDWLVAVENEPLVARTNHELVVFQDAMWALGGSERRRAEVVRSPNGIDWEIVSTSVPWGGFEQHYYAQSVAFRDKLWTFSGRDDEGAWSSGDGKDWVAHEGAFPWGTRRQFEVVVFDEKIFLLGGYDPATLDYFNDVWSTEDGLNWTLVTANAEWSPRRSPHPVVFNNELWVLGGFYSDGQSSGYIRDAWTSPDGLNWTKKSLSTLPTYQNSFTVAALENKMVMITDDDYDRDVWSAGPDGRWTQEPVVELSGDRAQLVAFDNALYAVGLTPNVLYSPAERLACEERPRQRMRPFEFDLANTSLFLRATDTEGGYTAAVQPADCFPTNPADGLEFALGGDTLEFSLPEGKTFPIGGIEYSRFFLAQGEIRFGINHAAAPHVSLARKSCLGTRRARVVLQHAPDRVVVTFLESFFDADATPSSFQAELFYNGDVRLTWLNMDFSGVTCRYIEVGVFPDLYPAVILGTDISTTPECPGSPAAEPYFCDAEIAPEGGLLFLETFNGNFDLDYKSVTFTPSASGNSYTVCVEDRDTLPSSAEDAQNFSSGTARLDLVNGATFPFYGASYPQIYVERSGVITLTERLNVAPDLERVLTIPSILASGGSNPYISYVPFADHVALNYSEGPQDPPGFQIELFYDGRIRMTFLPGADRSVVGLCEGLGSGPPPYDHAVPIDLAVHDWSASEACDPDAGGTYDTPVFGHYGGQRIDDTAAIAHSSLTLTPREDGNGYDACRQPVTEFFVDPDEGHKFGLPYLAIPIKLVEGKTLSLFGAPYDGFWLNGNGNITFDQPDTPVQVEPIYPEIDNARHFAFKRISGLYANFRLHPTIVNVDQRNDRVAVTYRSPEVGSTQIEHFFDGRIRLTWLDIAVPTAVVGLGPGVDLTRVRPADYRQADLVGADSCEVTTEAPSASVEKHNYPHEYYFDKFDLEYQSLNFSPDDSPEGYAVCRAPAFAFPEDRNNASYRGTSVRSLRFSGRRVNYHGSDYDRISLSHTGYIGFGELLRDDYSEGWSPVARHFEGPRLSFLLRQFGPQYGYFVEEREDAIVVTYTVPDGEETFAPEGAQVELFRTGRIRITWLAVRGENFVVGPSPGYLPLDFQTSNLSGKALCTPIQNRPEDPFASLVFTDVTADAGIDIPASVISQSCAWGDYDNDGDDDLYVTNFGPNVLYRNNGDGTFTDATASARVGDDGNSIGTAWGDLDNDGDLDLFCTSFRADERLDILYRNLGSTSPVFTNIVTSEGTFDRSSSRGMAFLDYDNDGFLDLYVTATGPDLLYRNLGGWHFESVAPSLDMVADGEGVGVVATDADNNGWIDIYTGNRSNLPNPLFLNTFGSFENVTTTGTMLKQMASAGNLYQTGLGMGVISIDHDNDQDFDLYWTNWPGDDPANPGTNAFYENIDGRNFTPVTAATGTADPFGWGISANTADVNNDGWEDMFVANGFSPDSGPSVLYLNNRHGGFTTIPMPAPENGYDDRGVAFADYDGDGDQDIYITGGTDTPGRLLRNDTTPVNNMLALKLTGTLSNRSAIGARVTVTAGDLTMVKEVSGGAGRGSQNSLPVEFGLGTRDVIDSVRITWPSGFTQDLGSLAPNETHLIAEPLPRVTVVPPGVLSIANDPCDLLIEDGTFRVSLTLSINTPVDTRSFRAFYSNTNGTPDLRRDQPITVASLVPVQRGLYAITLRVPRTGGYVYVGRYGGATLYASGKLPYRVAAGDTLGGGPAIALRGDLEITVECGYPFAEPGYTAFDCVDGDLTGAVSVSGADSIRGNVGVHTVRYVVQDRAGNHAEATRTVTVVDTQAPIITPRIGHQTRDCGSIWTDSAVSAYDTCDGSVSVESDAATAFDIDTPGDYTITYRATDANGNVAVMQRAVTVRDILPPAIEVIGGDVTLNCGEEWIDPGIRAVDQCEGPLSVNVDVDSDLDVDHPGLYVITYRANDSGGRTGVGYREVRVMDNCGQGEGEGAPVITTEEARALLADRLDEADLDRDGRLSFAEASAVVPELTPELFAELDTNNDGFLSRDELGLSESPGGCGCSQFGDAIRNPARFLGDLLALLLAMIVVTVTAPFITRIR